MQLKVSHEDHGYLRTITDYNNQLASDQTWYTYIIKCRKHSGKNKDKIKYYVGQTWNLKKRFREHASSKGSKWMKQNNFKPVKYVYYERCVSRSKSLQKENTWKNKSHDWKQNREEEFSGEKIDALMDAIKR